MDTLIILFIFIVLVAVSVGLVWTKRHLTLSWTRFQYLSRRVLIEDALKHIFQVQYNGRRPSVNSVAGTLKINDNDAADLLHEMESHDLICLEGGSIRLMPNGRDAALHIIRAHRLWERYLADETGFAETEWHRRAERAEHRLSPEELSDLAQRLGNPSHDPHGDPIPTENGEMVPMTGQSLTTAPVERLLQIVHIEDEPLAIYAQLVALGLSVDMPLRILEKTKHRLRLWIDGNEHVLAPIMANNISVIALPDAMTHEFDNGARLSQLKPGQQSQVVWLSRSCRGAERRRLLDLGFVPGTTVNVEMGNPLGDPMGYRVRGTVVGLRHEQADYIHVKTPEEVAA